PGGVSGTSRRARGGPDGTDGTAPDGTSPGGSGTPGVGTSRPRGSCATAEQESHEPNDDTWPVAATSGREQAHPYEPAARTTERKSNLLWVTFMPSASSNDMHSISIVNVSIWSLRETEGWRGRNCPSARGGVAIAEVARAGRTGGLPAMRKGFKKRFRTLGSNPSPHPPLRFGEGVGGRGATQGCSARGVFTGLAFAAGGLLGDDGVLGQLGRRHADPLETLGDDAVGRRQQADEEVHR